MATWEEITTAIKSEREYQDSMGEQWDHKGKPSISEELLLMDVYLKDAKDVWAHTTNDMDAIDFMRKIVGRGVRCFENHGVPLRAVKKTEE